MAVEMHRRDFLKTGLFGGAMLATGSSLALLSGCSSNDGPAEGYLHLRKQDVELLLPLTGVVLAQALETSGASAQTALKAYDKVLDGAMPGTRATMFQLFDLMQLGAARWYITGSWASFADQDQATLTQTLQAWFTLDRTLSRMAWKGLVQPLMFAWFAQPEAGLTTGYPGPPQRVIS